MSRGSVDSVGHLRGRIGHKKISPVSRFIRNIWINNSCRSRVDSLSVVYGCVSGVSRSPVERRPCRIGHSLQSTAQRCTSRCRPYRVGHRPTPDRIIHSPPLPTQPPHRSSRGSADGPRKYSGYLPTVDRLLALITLSGFQQHGDGSRRPARRLDE